MPSLSPSDTAFIVSQHYASKSAVQIQRKFRRDRKQKVAFPTVSRWLKRVKTEFEESRLNSTVHHTEIIYEELRENGIEPYPSGGRPFDAEGGYPPKSHDCMPCELINDRLKENARKSFERLRKSRRNMKSMQTQVAKEARKMDIEFIRDRIACLPKILMTIEANEGGRTKY